MEQLEFECRRFTNIISQFVDSTSKTENWIQHAILEIPNEMNPNEYKKCVEYDFFQKCMQQRKIQWNMDEKKWKSNSIILQYIIPYRKMDIYS